MSEPKKKLTLSDVKLNMSTYEVFRYYFPDMTNEEASFLLWNRTCYPFDPEESLSQIYDLYLESLKK